MPGPDFQPVMLPLIQRLADDQEENSRDLMEPLMQVLRDNHCITDEKVVQVAIHRIGQEIGFLDRLLRMTITYDTILPSAPESLVLKLSSLETKYQQIGNFYNAYDREFHFYQSIAGKSNIRLPRCYAHEFDRQTNAHLLVLEDLGALSTGDQVRGLTSAQAAAAVETIGNFHARWWDSPDLDSFPWLPSRNIQSSRYLAAWPLFRELFSSRLPATAIALGDYLCVHLDALLGDIEQRPHTIVHSDFRADNLLFEVAPHPQPVVVLDWQLAIRGAGILDVARLLCGSLNPQERAAGEMQWIERWHATLVARGIPGYSLQQATDDYRTAALICLYYPVTIYEAETAAGKRGSTLARAQIERFFAAAQDLNASVIG